jgi:hypothetical protein
MKTKLMVLFTSAVLLLTGCTTSQHAAKAWDYKIVSGAFFNVLEREINKAAADGCVLASASCRNDSEGFAVMKRPKPAQ